jgi:hypothetical protein
MQLQRCVFPVVRLSHGGSHTGPHDPRTKGSGEDEKKDDQSKNLVASILYADIISN